jgi:hypothetical protein
MKVDELLAQSRDGITIIPVASVAGAGGAGEGSGGDGDRRGDGGGSGYALRAHPAGVYAI